MARIHEDTFQVGDLVTWRNEDMATATDGRKKYGNVISITGIQAFSNSVLEATGHRQLVSIGGDCHQFSGAFFRHLAPWEKKK